MTMTGLSSAIAPVIRPLASAGKAGITVYPRHHGEQGLQALGMLRTLPPAAADDHADDQRHPVPAAADVMRLAGIVENLVEGQQGEFHPVEADDRPLAEQGSTERHAGQTEIGRASCRERVGQYV